ncbi:DRAP deaminase [Dimargaris verticillata]|uniref:Pseudouridine synthase n=1 Tax=Dimargaris verticillata TaxID=2761393 RepID=A0A9W8B000_9FUNG|nr:DRAP deaminase [Dimargaris verticillata]
MPLKRRRLSLGQDQPIGIRTADTSCSSAPLQSVDPDSNCALLSPAPTVSQDPTNGERSSVEHAFTPAQAPGGESRVRENSQRPASRPKHKIPKASATVDWNEIDAIEDYCEHGLRKVTPYDYTYQTYAKGRWIGLTLLELFTREFRDQPPSYYDQAIRSGRIRINNAVVDSSTCIKGHDVIMHRIHRHEPPVADQPVTVVHETDDVMVVNKPASIPVHPSGRYRHNTLLHILYKQQRYVQKAECDLFPVNRLDRLTSGIVILAKNLATARQFETQMKGRTIFKTYLCKVKGSFPIGVTWCKEPIKTVAHKLGLNAVHPDGKPCATMFEKLSEADGYSLVQCKPLTGRTHQIRVHLQYLGYPIGNDPLYCNEKVWGSGTTADQLKQSQIIDQAITNLTQLEAEKDASVASVTLTHSTAVPECNTSTGTTPNAGSNLTTESPFPGFDASCGQCQQYRRSPIPDPTPDQLLLWLHALEYRSEQGWVFATDPPAWAIDWP